MCLPELQVLACKWTQLRDCRKNNYDCNKPHYCVAGMVTCLNLFDPPNSPLKYVIVPILQKRTLRYRKVEAKWQARTEFHDSDTST